MMTREAMLAAYPTEQEVSAWLDGIWALADATPDFQAEILPKQGFTHNLGIRHTRGFQYVKFTHRDGHVYYGYWQQALSLPAPLLVHVPGYGAEMSSHPDLVAQGYNILHISPLGYSTPDGASSEKRRNNNWPVLPDTILTGGTAGYRLWLLDCLLAIRWALTQPEVIPSRLSFFGTSQGGGGALLLTSLYHGRGVRCVAADLPFLTNFPVAAGRGAYGMVKEPLSVVGDSAGWHAIGLVDTISHAHRLDVPVLLTAAGADSTCPPETIEGLFHRLRGTKSYTYLKDVGHRYTQQFIPLAAAWFRLFA
jgi:cephalosporin-C deacetylase-like acetyl esterase